MIDDPLLADGRNFYKDEKWTKDGSKFVRMLYAIYPGFQWHDAAILSRMSEILPSGKDLRPFYPESQSPG